MILYSGGVAPPCGSIVRQWGGCNAALRISHLDVSLSDSVYFMGALSETVLMGEVNSK